ncbi:S-layer homology domain-containing protein [Candidatus Saganbacteria bacterium]|nr:S-layer homology domain-containing protein [Candidatus Saganbacteria bacterium]
MFSTKAFAVVEASDPALRSPNARVVGMGRAYAGLSDDTSGIFINPSGLARKTDWQISSMSSKFLDAYNYLSLSGYYSTNFGVIGLGFGSYNIGGAYATTIDATSNPLDPIYKVDFTKPNINNYNNVFILNYSNTADSLIGKFIKLGWTDKIDVGINYKLFNAGLSGGGLAGASGTGNEIDLGAMYRLSPSMKIGIAVQDILPASWGGKITYMSGHYEIYPALFKLGTTMALLGEENSLLKFRKQELIFAADLDNYLIGKAPLTYHLGLEWNPNIGLNYLGFKWNPYNMLFVRLGIDQTTGDDGTGRVVAISYPTFGVGFYYGGFKFDYAYHPLPVVNLDSSYFSVSYIPPLKKLEAPKEKDRMRIDSPSDKNIAFDQSIKIKGKISDLQALEINNNNVQFSTLGSFEAEAPVNIGKNKISIKGYSSKAKTGKPTDEKLLRVLRLAAFPDVTEGYWTRQQVSLVSMLNIVTGYPDGSFRPEGNITRAEMAALLMRAEIPNPNGKIQNNGIKFIDIKFKHWASKFIADAAAAKVVEGYTDKTFRPNGNITRAEGVAMISRFAKVPLEAYGGQFPDINDKHWASSIISGSFKAGLLGYLSGKAFEPKRMLTRAEAVEILYRTQFVKNLLDKDLLDWESY